MSESYKLDKFTSLLSGKPQFLIILLFLIVNLQFAHAIPKDYQSLVRGVHKLTLDNGMRVIFAQRSQAPVFNAQLWVKVGSADEVVSKTGAAHLLEHMAFKGTEVIGTKDFNKEKDLLDKYEVLLDEMNIDKSEKKLQELEKIKKDLEEISVEGEFTKLFETRGAKGLNAGTSSDYTMYTVNLPSSELEFWFYMESERLIRPIFRQFYKELEVVKEERRMRTDDSPSGKLYEALLAGAYWSHPYQAPTIGWPKDLLSLRKRDAEYLHKIYYRPDNMVAVIVGDIEIDKAKQFAEKYFGRLKKPNDPLIFRKVEESKQEGERKVKVKYKSEPEFLVGYHKPTYPNPDSAQLGLLYSLLDEGRSSPFQKILVQNKQLVSQIYTTERPGERYDPVFIIGGTPVQGVTTDQVLQEIDKILVSLDLSDKVLDTAKKTVKVNVLKGLSSNQGLASNLGQRELLYGDWKDLFTEIEQAQNVTANDIRRVVKKYLVPSNRTVVTIDAEDSL